MAVLGIKAENGFKNLFEEVFLRYRDNVYRYNRRVLGNPHDAEDVTQETFLRVYRAMPQFRGECAIGTWIFRIASSACMDHLRSARRREVPCIDGHASEDVPFFQLADPLPGPEEMAEGADVRDGVKECLHRMRDDHKTVLLLREVKDMSYIEISRAMGCPIGTVKSKLNRARTALRREVLERVPV